MTLNVKKCFQMKFTNKNYSVHSEYYIGQNKIKRVNEIRDVGVIFDEKLTFVPHIESIIKKASRMLYFVGRNIKVFKGVKIKTIIYNGLVRSILEYCSVVWRPHYATHSLRIERIQKRFVTYLSY
jgi:hypothetical protein